MENSKFRIWKLQFDISNYWRHKPTKLCGTKSAVLIQPNLNTIYVEQSLYNKNCDPTKSTNMLYNIGSRKQAFHEKQLTFRCLEIVS